MVIAKLQGGLGNQMFQYALGRHLALLNRTNLFLDTASLLDRTPRDCAVFRDFDLSIFAMPVSFVTEENLALFQVGSQKSIFFKSRRWTLRRLGCLNYELETNFAFNKSLLALTGHIYLDGYWQSEKYFSAISEIIRRDFTFGDSLSPVSAELLTEIKSGCSVCVNVRRGDFVSLSTAAQYHGTCSLDYYRQAWLQLCLKFPGAKAYIFSDDIEWCKDNLSFLTPSKIVDHSHAGKKFGAYLELMSNCRHFIIPNSSFGWWAAWLGQATNKHVIAPQRWLKNEKANTQLAEITPAEWLRL